MNVELEYKIQNEIAKFNYEYDQRREKLKALRALNHGHEFGRDLVCRCGITPQSYFNNFRGDIYHHCCLRTLEDMQKEYNVLVSTK